MRTENGTGAVLTVNGAVTADRLISALYTDDLNGAADPKIGSACAASLRLVIDRPAAAYAGAELTLALGGVPLGVFTVTAAEEREGRLTVEALDAMAGPALAAEYVPAGTDSTALAVIRQIAAATGLETGDMSGVTDVPVTGLSAGRTRRETLGLMAALLGRNAHIDREGRLCLRWYESSGVALTADDYYAGELSLRDGDYAIARIECTASRTVAASRPDGTATEETVTTVYAAGEGETGVSLIDDYMTQDILDGVYADIGGLTYRPMTVTFYGDPRIETGDILTVTDAAGTTHTVPVMKVVHAWDGGVRTTVTAFGDPAEGLSRSPAGALSKSVSNLMAEFARFKNLEADNVRAVSARLDELFADWASIGTAIIDTLQANGISADWINAGALTVTDANGNILFKADKEQRTVQMGGYTVSDGLLRRNGVLIGPMLVTYNPSTLKGCIMKDGSLSFVEDYAEVVYTLCGTVTGGWVDFSPGDDPDEILSVQGLRFEGASGFSDEAVFEKDVYVKNRNILSDIGALSSLTTTAKSSLVAAINEVDADITAINTVSSGTLTGNWLDMNYAKNGSGMKFLRCLAGPNAAMAAGTQRFVGTLPSGYRPSYNIEQPLVVNATTSSAVIAILSVNRTTGAVNITPMSAISTSTAININLAYI